MYIILEIQESAPGVVNTLTPVKKETRDEADSAFFSVCSFAAVSSCLTHTVMLFTHEGQLLDRKYWHHAPDESE